MKRRTRRVKMAPVMEYGGRWLNMKELAAATGLSYYNLSDRYSSGDRDEDLIRPLNAPRKRKKPPAPRKDCGPFRHEPKRQPNLARVQAEREARARVRAALTAALSAPLIGEDILSRDERNSIHRRVGSGLRWHGEVDVA